jgi:type I restriction-modification system DNA methylase subunit
MDSTKKSMAKDRIFARQQIEKLVQFFDSNIYQFKSPSFNETQARQQLIDPFFESLGWDVHNRLMLPLFRQEVVPESRVKTNVGKEVREQEALFPTKDTLSKEHKEYASILDYIAEDEYKASSKEAVKKPDYRFRIGGQTKFFVEAKKPTVDLAKSQSAIFQVKRYGFSGRVPLAILTDFEEFRTFDCTQRPAFEKPKLGVIHDFDLTYKQYLDHFEHLYDTFSREAVAGGSLEALTKKMMLKRTGDFALDREFLVDLSKWREELARDIAKHPKNRRLLNDYTLNEAVQRILDRIVFIRVCEDREIEVENTLLAILRMWKERPGLALYSLLNELFNKRRDLYNGLLFSPHQCEELEVGNDVLIKILENLNYPFSPYHFNEIGVEILGSIYEKFLGKTIHLTAKTTRIEEKPEVRKAGGVYYTPQYIVKYIVDNTLGKLLYVTPTASTNEVEATPPYKGGDTVAAAGLPAVFMAGDRGNSDHPTSTTSATEIKALKLSPKQVSKLKIIDIACGSGSFLLGAFQKLIDYHIEWYTTHPDDIKSENNVPDAYKDTSGNYHLSPRKKRDILVNNIYGVDIDRQAVEVTQMSLYLKVLEGENAETLNPQMTLALKEVYLPSLAKNIKCGNSLIGTDFTSQGEMFDEESRHKVNPFDWELEFPEILGIDRNSVKPSEGSPSGTKKPSQGSRGFDVVIGNPPWGSLFNESEKNYLSTRYINRQGEAESHLFFIEKATKILISGGLLGYITPNTWLSVLRSHETREFLLKNVNLREIDELSKNIFDDAPDIVPILVFVDNSKPKDSIAKIRTAHQKRVTSNNFDYIFDSKEVKQNKWLESDGTTINLSISDDTEKIKIRCNKYSVKLENLCDLYYGIKTGDNNKFLSKKKTQKHKMKALKTGELGRYRLKWMGYWLWWTPALAGYRNSDLEVDKIIIQYIRKLSLSQRIIAAYDDGFYYPLNNYSYILNKEIEYSLKYILGIINSSLMNYYYAHMFIDYNIKPTYLSQLPIRTIDFNNPAEKKMHDDLVSLVEKMLELNKQLQKAHFDSEKEPIERQIAATDKKIDDIVYELYGLTEEEITIVEGKTLSST